MRLGLLLFLVGPLIAQPSPASDHAPPLLMEKLAPGVTQELLAVTYTSCSPPTGAIGIGPCVNSGADQSITVGQSAGQNAFDDKGNVYVIVRYPSPTTAPLVMVSPDSSSSVKLAEFTLSPNGVQPCVQTGPATWMYQIRSIGPLAYNPAPQARAIFLNTSNAEYLFHDPQCSQIVDGYRYTTALIRMRVGK